MTFMSQAGQRSVRSPHLRLLVNGLSLETELLLLAPQELGGLGWLVGFFYLVVCFFTLKSKVVALCNEFD